jgi:hypothetical protein
VRKNEIWKKELMVEDYNQEILFYLSKGFKIKELEGLFISVQALSKAHHPYENSF